MGEDGVLLNSYVFGFVRTRYDPENKGLMKKGQEEIYVTLPGGCKLIFIDKKSTLHYQMILVSLG